MAHIQHKESRRIFDNNQSVDDALKAQIIDTINHTYLCRLQNKYTGYFTLKEFNTANNIEFQLVPPHMLRRNTAERAIQT
jgi:hypothetical protein